MRKSVLVTVGVMICLAAVAVSIPAAATTWCGENGLVRLSFAPGDTLVPVLDSGPASGGVTKIDLYAWLTDYDRVKHEGEVLTAIGAYEMSLQITGADAYILKQELPGEGFNVGRAQGTLAYGLADGLTLTPGRVLLAHWQIMFQGRPENVRFGLDPAQLQSCAKTEGCPGAGAQALYVGSASSNQLNMMFGAGYVPAWLNPADEPDLTPVRGNSPWQKVGVFEAR